MLDEHDISTPASSMTPRVFCKGCGYALIGLQSSTCPECGRGFDLGNRRTFARRRPRGWVWRWGRRVLAVVLLLVLAAGAGLFWLWWGWRAEQGTIARLRSPNRDFRVRSIGSERLQSVLGEPLGFLTDRVDWVEVDALAAAETEQMDFRSFTLIKRLVLSDCEMSNRNLNRLAGLAKLRELDLHHLRIEKPDLAFLEKLPALTILELSGQWVRSAGFEQIGRLGHLEYLSLINTGLGDADLQHLRGLSLLENLDLEGNPISEAGLVHLRGLTSLKRLWVDERLLVSPSMAKLEKAIPGLQVFTRWPPPR